MNHMQPAQRRSTQQGVVLVVCLIFLLVLTVLGVTAMRTTQLEERMAGNARNGKIAFQAAEAALREGEEWVMDIDLYDPPSAITICASPPCELWEKNAAALVELHLQDAAWWQTQGREYGSGTDAIAEAGADPRFIVEYIGYDPGVTIIDTDERAQQLGPHLYRGSAAGFGGDTAAQRVVQSTVRINKN